MQTFSWLVKEKRCGIVILKLNCTELGGSEYTRLNGADGEYLKRERPREQTFPKKHRILKLGGSWRLFPLVAWVEMGCIFLIFCLDFVSHHSLSYVFIFISTTGGSCQRKRDGCVRGSCGTCDGGMPGNPERSRRQRQHPRT